MTSKDNDENVVRLCRGFGNATRLEILRQIGLGCCNVGEIVEQLGLEQSRVSKHLAVLLNVGMVRCEVDGPRRCYRLEQPKATMKILLLLKEMQAATNKT
jgi:DNA-binding transcriptional ArsR family regulator